MIRIYEYNQVGDAEIFARQEKKQDVSGAVSRIIADVRQNGDDALKRYGQEFDNAELQTLEVSAEERATALAAVDADFLEILREAAAHIRAFHEKQKRQDFVAAEREGVLLGQRHIPLERVGLYVPGGTASYPSTVLMDCIPAKIRTYLRRQKWQALIAYSKWAGRRRLPLWLMAQRACRVWIKLSDRGTPLSQRQNGRFSGRFRLI